MKAFVLCGGLGTRVSEISGAQPKSLLNFDGHDFLDILLSQLCVLPLKEVILLAGFRGNEIHKKYHLKVQNGIRIYVQIEDSPLGTLGCFQRVLDRLDEKQIIVNGDTYIEFKNLSYWGDLDDQRNKRDIIFPIYKDNVSRYGSLTLGIKHVKSFNEKGPGDCPGYINSGVYILTKDAIVSGLARKFSSLEKQLFVKLAEDNSLFYEKDFIKTSYDIGTIHSHDRFLKKRMERPSIRCIFWDRDNTIHFDRGYNTTFDPTMINNTFVKIASYASSKSIKNFIVSNQSGIAKGKFEEQDTLNFHFELKSWLLKKGTVLDDFQFCPHHPDGIIGAYTRSCECRKPGTAMIKELTKRWNIDLSKSLYVGDSDSDFELAKKLNIQFFHLDMNKEQLNDIKKLEDCVNEII